jgi:(R,R)-butanediol dehydrogenase / meso-butanediol dehydrogenase / diacetyl reductase
MRAAVYHGPRDIRIEQVAEPEPGPGDVLVEVSRNGICGSDLHTYLGSGAASLHLPGIVLGHEFAGTVRAVGRDIDDLAIGAVVAIAPIEWCGECAPCRAGEVNLCRRGGIYGGFRLPLHGGLAPLVSVSRRAAYEVPESLDAVSAALAEPVAVAVHAVRRAPRTLGATVVVLGAGPIGLAVLQAVRAAGATTMIVSEPSSARRARATAFGASLVIDPRADDLRAAVRDLAPAGADLVFDTAGAQEALGQGISVLRAHGTLVNVAQWSTPPTVDFGRAMAKEIDLRFAFTYEPEIDFPTALALLASGEVDAGAMITDHISLGALVDDGLEALLHDADEHVKILVDPHRT